MRLIYNVLTHLMAPVLLLHLWWRGQSNPAYRRRIGERFGFLPQRQTKPGIWVHAVSVGEVQAAAELIRSLMKRYPNKPLILTTMTPTGSQRAQELFGDSVIHSYVPYDISGSVRRFFERAMPELVIIIETELWPNLFRECGRRQIPLVLASARVSARSVGRYQRMVSLIRETLSHGVVIAAQTDTDAERFRSLGANPLRIHVTGNIKFDFHLDPEVTNRGTAIRRELAANRPVWIAASTHGDEEEIVLAAHRRLLETYPDALLILVPRHPERFQSVETLIGRADLAAVTRSSRVQCDAETQVFLADSMGELPMFYAAADVAFVGGSLVPIGGHNLLEPAALGLPVLTGPNNFNAPEIAQLLIDDEATRVIHDANELADQLGFLLDHPDERRRRGGAGRAVIDNNRGALARLLELIDPLIA
jgi:3-deoxy-D-manno-octulosonic-acid transferase